MLHFFIPLASNVNSLIGFTNEIINLYDSYNADQFSWIADTINKISTDKRKFSRFNRSITFLPLQLPKTIEKPINIT